MTDRGPGRRPPDRHRRTLRIARLIGALALLATGGIHLEQYEVAHFSVIPTIGPLFLVNFIAGTGLGLVLLMPLPRSVGWRRVVFEAAVAFAGIGMAGGAFAALIISEHTPLFGFMEHGYRLEIVIALGAEAAAIVALGVMLICLRARLGEIAGGRTWSTETLTPGRARPAAKG